MGIELHQAEMDVRASFPTAEKYGVGTGGAAMDELSYTLDIRSPAGSAAIRELVDRARGACHAENSLRVAPVVALRLNGEDQPA